MFATSIFPTGSLSTIISAITSAISSNIAVILAVLGFVVGISMIVRLFNRSLSPDDVWYDPVEGVYREKWWK